MNTLVAWIMSILGIVVVGTLVDLILPSGRVNKFLKGIFATITVLVIVMPIPSLIKNNFNVGSGSLIQPEFELDSSYLEYAEKTKMKYLAKGVEIKLEEDGYKNVSILIDGTFSGNEVNIKLVTINLQNVVIDEKVAHINSYEKIKELVTKYLNIDKGVVVING